MKTVLGHKSTELIRFQLCRLFLDGFLFLLISAFIIGMIFSSYGMEFYLPFLIILIALIVDGAFCGKKLIRMKKRNADIIILNGDNLELYDKNNNRLVKSVEGIMVISFNQHKRFVKYGILTCKFGSLFLYYGDHTIEIEEVEAVEDVCRRLQNIVSLRETYAFNCRSSLIG